MADPSILADNSTQKQSEKNSTLAFKELFA